MIIETVMILPPTIKQTFNVDLLLDFLGRSIRKLNEKIKPLSEKKFREQDIGRKREFANLLVKYEQEYGRKTNDQKIFKEKIKNKIENRSRIST